MRILKLILILIPVFSLTACGSLKRLENVGKKPALSAIENPASKPGYKPVRMPMPVTTASIHQPNSLWRSGSRAFFKDQRARKVGDILTVNVRITDKAEIDNKTTQSRVNNQNSTISALAGFGKKALKLLPSGAALTPLTDTDSTTKSEGEGSVDREEKLTVTMAAVINQVLPNGNLVIEGKQEVRVNFEVRELIVAGVVRPEDISAQNTIDSTKIAEARISYGGRGQISDMQQPRYGQQVLDILLPF